MFYAYFARLQKRQMIHFLKNFLTFKTITLKTSNDSFFKEKQRPGKNKRKQSTNEFRKGNNTNRETETKWGGLIVNSLVNKLNSVKFVALKVVSCLFQNVVL